MTAVISMVMRMTIGTVGVVVGVFVHPSVFYVLTRLVQPTPFPCCWMVDNTGP